MSEFATTTFDFPINEKSIAQYPAEKRDHSRLMVLDCETKTREHKVFSDIIDYLNPGDLLVLNNTKVMPARLLGKKEKTGASCELLLLKNLGKDQWEALARPGKRLKPGSKIIFGNNELTAEILGETNFGGKIVKFLYSGNFYQILEKLGLIPLPPYIKSHQSIPVNHELAERYQTVYSAQVGASAAPTAGLHFTPELLEKIKQKGIQIEYLTLHTGLGTFRPITAEDIREHDIHSEWYKAKPNLLNKIKETKAHGNRVIAVGTTAVRVLETIAAGKELEGFTNIYIYPGFEFKFTDALITNFHLPKSTLLVLVSAFAGKDFILDSYQEALENNYRFYSFGDAMLIR